MNPTYNNAPPQVRFGWINESWQLFCAQWPTWVLTALIFTLLNQGILLGAAYVLGITGEWKYLLTHLHDLSAMSGPSAPHSDPVSSLLFDGVIWVVSAFFYGGLFRMSNKQVRGGQISVGELFSGGPTFLPMLGYVIIFGLISSFGACCFCVGALVVYALLFPAFAMIADGVSFGDALTRSFEGMKQDWLRASLYVFVFSLIVLAGFIPLGLGFLITTPMTYLSTSLAYRDMIGMTNTPGGGGYSQGPPAPGVWPTGAMNTPDSGAPPANPSDTGVPPTTPSDSDLPPPQSP